MTRRLLRYGAYGLLALTMPLVVVLSATLYYAFDSDFYRASFAAEGTAALLELSDADMERVITGMTDYLSGRSDSMELTVALDGRETRFYSDKELAHMVDVRNLMALGASVRSGLLVLGLALLGLLTVTGGCRTFWRGLLASALGALGFAALLGVLAATDFSGAFYRFHELFFTNDLWLLDPATDRLIRMLPESFFFAITARILTVSGLAVAAAGAAAVWGIRRCGPDAGGR